jgi:acyl carrier protein
VPDQFTEKVLNTVASVKRIPLAQVTLDRPLQDLGFDSLDTMVLLFELEKQFEISISDEAVRSVRTVRDVVDGIAGILSGGSQDSLAPQGNP